MAKPTGTTHASRARREQAPAPAPARGDVSRWTGWLGSILVACAILVTYFNSLRMPFQFDDVATIVENASIRRLWPLADVLFSRVSIVAGRPLLNLTYAINYRLGGLDVLGYHAVNVANHVLCAILLFQIIRLTLESTPFEAAVRHQAAALALVSTLIWALHPIQTGTVTYLSARSESLMSLFYLATLYAGIRALPREASAAWRIAAVAACAAGMACKESMVTAPVVVALYDRAFRYDSFRAAVRERGRFYCALAATWIVLVVLLWPAPRAGSAGFGLGVSAWMYLLNQTAVLTEYLRVTLVPTSLIFAYGEPRSVSLLEVGPYAALICGLAVLTVWAWFVRPAAGFAGVWFFATLAPTSSIVPIATEVGAERRMYLPLASLAVLIVFGVRALVERVEGRGFPGRAIAVERIVACAVIVTLAILTIQRNTVYASAEDLWRSSLAVWPSSVAHRNLATALSKAGNREEALQHLNEAVADHPEARYIIGVNLFEMRRYDESIAELETYLRGKPTGSTALDAREILGRSWTAKGDPNRAADQFVQILQARPNQAASLIGLADARLAQNRLSEAASLYEQYLQSHPDHEGALINLGIALLRGGNLPGAVHSLERAVAIAPDSATAHRNLATALFTSRDLDRASSHAARAAALKPDDATTHELYGEVLAARGQSALAADQFQIALNLDPSRTDLREELQRLRAAAPTRH
jgi:tetratricopeptide (TPR) repeat protein